MEKFKPLYAEYDCNLNDEQVKAEIAKILEENLDAHRNEETYKKIFNLIDLTSLNTTDTQTKIIDMVKKVNNFENEYPDMPNVAALCVYPSLVEVAVDNLEVNIPVAAVCACFPSSQTFIEAKVAEVGLTVMAGAREIDIVQSVGKYLEGYHTEVSDEIMELKSACRDAHLKVILESGALPSCSDIKKSSIIAMVSGADFIKTSTGKQNPAATLEATYVMCNAIKEYYTKTGKKIGFKPAGGISTTEEAIQFYTIAHTILGDEWMNNNLFRFGASRLANNLLSSIYGKEIKYF